MKHSLTVKVFVLISFLMVSLDTFSQDLTPPDTPVLDSVTVLWTIPINPNGDVLITWQKSDSIDVRSYYIKYFNEVLGTYKLLDSVDANTTSYLDFRGITDPLSAPQYVVQAVDSSNNTSNHSSPHQLVSLNSEQTIVDCKLNLEFLWNQYLGWDEGLDYFDLYYIDGDERGLLGRFNSGKGNFNYEINNEEDHFQFFIRTTSRNGRTSTSNKMLFIPDLSHQPEFIDLMYVTVENEQIRLKFSLDSSASINNYKLMRSVDNLMDFKAIMTFDNYQFPYLDATDAEVSVNSHQYFYKLNLYDDCDSLIDSSTVRSSILLKGNLLLSEHEQILRWTDYYNESNYSTDYYISRTTSTSFPNVLSQTSENKYIDDLKVQDFSVFEGDFCYTVYVQPEDWLSDTVRSNSICLSHPPLVYIPNAFSPYGLGENKVFKPSTAFISFKNYYLAIFDRWGSKLFETKDPTEGWTGKTRVEEYPNGAYNYYLEYYSTEGEKSVKSGSFNLIN